MNERVFNLFLFIDHEFILELGAASHEIKGTETEKVNFLRSQAETDLKTALRFPIPDRYRVVDDINDSSTPALRYELFSKLQAVGQHYEVFEAFKASETPLSCITPVVNGKLHFEQVDLGAISLLRQFPGENARWATRTAMSPPSCPTRPYRQRQEAVEIFRNRPRCGTGLIPPTPSRTAAGLRPQGIWNPRFSSQVFIPQCRNHGSYADSRSPRLKSPGL